MRYQILKLPQNVYEWHYSGADPGGRGGGPPPLKLEKNMIFGVKS